MVSSASAQEVSSDSERSIDGAAVSTNGSAGDATNFARRHGGVVWRVGIDLALNPVTTATAAMYFQRFYLVEQQGNFDAMRVAMACVWLASKVCEEKTRLRDIVNSFLALQEHGGVAQVNHAGKASVARLFSVQSGLNASRTSSKRCADGDVKKQRPGTSNSGKEDEVLQMEEYWSLRDDLVVCEQAVLRAMAFDVEPTSAYSFLLEFVWLLNCGAKEQGIVTLAWTLLNDAFCSEICAVSPPARMAIACLLLAAEMGRRVPHLKAQAEHVASNVDSICREPHLEDFLCLGPSSGADEVEELVRSMLAVYEVEHAARTSQV